MIVDALHIALRQLARNKTRTMLTSLGVLIGVAAVISMIAIGRGATASVEGDLAAFGQNILFLGPGSPSGPPRAGVRPLSEADADAIRGQVPGLRGVAPVSQRMAYAVAGEATWRTTVGGATNDYWTVMTVEVGQGRVFEDGELLAGADVCVLGPTVAGELFGAQEPLGQTVRVEALTCRVIGVTVPRGQNTFGMDQDDYLIVPLRTYQRRIAGSRDVDSVVVSAADGVPTERVKGDLEALMRQRRHVRPGAEDDFVVRDMAEITAMLQGVSTVLTGFLAAIAAVSLLVGGIGIMNIMLVSVTERTREIGIRLAVGALARDVMTQFLVEAAVLSGIGGLLGIAAGIGVSWAATAALGVPLVVDPIVVIGAFAFSAAIGLVFGWFPARRAARMRPIDALRHE